MSETQPRADWYPDPLGRHEYRYWDGERWTDNAATGGRTIHDPLEGGGAPAATAARTGWETPRATTSGKAIASLILSLVSFPSGFFLVGPILAVAGIVLGVLARRDIARGDAPSGSGIALAGIVLGVLSLLLFTLAIVFFFSAFTVNVDSLPVPAWDV